MSSATVLKKVLVGDYEVLKRRLARRLGSDDLAGEVLQETYLHLERPLSVGALGNPRHYLLTIAINIARMRFRRERRLTSLSDLDAALGFVDEAPDQLRSLEARQELETLRAAFDELTPRRRHILCASRLDGRKLSDIAIELGVSQRLIEKELKAALLACGLRVQRQILQRFGPRARQTSANEPPVNGASDPNDDHDP